MSALLLTPVLSGQEGRTVGQWSTSPAWQECIVSLDLTGRKHLSVCPAEEPGLELQLADVQGAALCAVGFLTMQLRLGWNLLSR